MLNHQKNSLTSSNNVLKCMDFTKNHPPLILISGPSGAGEDSVIEAMVKRFSAIRVITSVTRKPRGSEQEGSPYYFITREDFQRMREANAFIEWAEVYGDYRGATYKEIERCLTQPNPVLWKMDWQGVANMQTQFPESLSIVITPPNKDTAVLTERLKKRGDPWEEIQKRQKFSAEWMRHLDVYDNVIENKEGRLPETIQQAEMIVKQKFF